MTRAELIQSIKKSEILRNTSILVSGTALGTANSNFASTSIKKILFTGGFWRLLSIFKSGWYPGYNIFSEI